MLNKISIHIMITCVSHALATWLVKDTCYNTCCMQYTELKLLALYVSNAVAESENGDLRYSALCWLSLCVCRWIRTHSLYITVAALPFRSLLSKRRTKQPGCRQLIGEYPISHLSENLVRDFMDNRVSLSAVFWSYWLTSELSQCQLPRLVCYLLIACYLFAR